ncbi:DUF4126 domain-containing protein [Krasilnikovia sp. MM14-A1259]|uniref:DUF4126 domain-containing protein n=1 Tax=Krasilnikovia sp. MM14-A1259 TaxID=3373539 RepID=UPI0037F294AB
MLEVLTGTGLATSAGLNAYIPLLIMGLLARFTDLVELPAGWQWLSGGWALAVLTVLLAVEVVADKVPVVDHVNDVVQTVVRPAAGGLAFGAGSAAQTATVPDPGALSTHQWTAIVAGVLIALCVHGVKAASRPVVNATTAGFGAPVVSTIEDIGSAVLSVLAILVPILVLAAIVAFVGTGVWVVRRRRRRRRQRQAAEGVETVRLFG